MRAAAGAIADARMHDIGTSHTTTTAETVDVRMGRVELVPGGLAASRKRNRFISVLIATIERFGVGEETGPMWTALEKLERRRRMQLQQRCGLKVPTRRSPIDARFRRFRQAFKLAAGDCSRRRSRQFLSTLINFRCWLGVTARSGIGSIGWTSRPPLLIAQDRNLFEFARAKSMASGANATDMRNCVHCEVWVLREKWPR
jgi:hypothetical protein